MCLLVYMYMCILYITLGTVVCVAKLDTNVEFYFIFVNISWSIFTLYTHVDI